ncbi:MAG: response regulator transcription factor [Bacteroidota bacterium]
MKIRCIAIDDEPLALEKIASYVERVPFLELKGKFTSAIEAMEFLNDQTVDLIFLDIQMDELTGIQFLEILKNKPKVILTTAYDQYALKGYELDVTDYLLKPITFQRFLKAVHKVHDALMNVETQKTTVVGAENKASQQDYIFLKSGTRIEKINLNDILFVEGMKEYLRIHTPTARIMTLMSFKKMEELIPQDNFIRIHKSYLVRIDKIETIESQHVKIAGHSLPIGEMYRKAFYEVLKSRGLA